MPFHNAINRIKYWSIEYTDSNRPQNDVVLARTPENHSTPAIEVNRRKIMKHFLIGGS
jgi:hypothetical protein